MREASTRPPGRPKSRAIARRAAASRRRLSLCETLDRVLHKGAVIAGDIIISVADVELLYVGLNLVVCSVETMQDWAGEGSGRALGPTVTSSGSLRQAAAAGAR